MTTFLKGAAVTGAATVLILAGSPVASPLPAPATVIESFGAQHPGARTTVTLRGDGQLTPANVEETAEPPRRLVIDFAGVTSRASAPASLESPHVNGVKIGVNSGQPLVISRPDIPQAHAYRDIARRVVANLATQRRGAPRNVVQKSPLP